MSLDLATKVVNHILSYEDPASTTLSLKVHEDGATGVHHVYCEYANYYHPELSYYDSLFKCHDDLPSYCLFSFESSTDLTSFFKLVANPESALELAGQAKTQTHIVWMKTLFHRLKEQTGQVLFNELLKSVLIDLSIKFEKEGEIILNFSKHSDYLNKNIHFEIELDMEFTIQSVLFRSYTYTDNYQRETLPKFKPENQLAAFHTLLSYYCHQSVHQSLDMLINVANDLNDDNLHAYEHMVNMIKI